MLNAIDIDYMNNTNNYTNLFYKLFTSDRHVVIGCFASKQILLAPSIIIRNPLAYGENVVKI
jgi:hypothetical protein